MNGVRKSNLKNKIDYFKMINDKRIKEIKNLKRENEDLKKTQGGTKQEIKN